MPDAFFTTAAATLQSKRDLLSGGLRAAGFDVSHPRGSYFVIADGAPLGFDDAVELCRRLPDLAGVVAIPVSAFIRPDRRDGSRSLLRFAFCKSSEVLGAAIDGLGGIAPRMGAIGLT